MSSVASQTVVHQHTLERHVRQTLTFDGGGSRDTEVLVRGFGGGLLQLGEREHIKVSHTNCPAFQHQVMGG